MLEGLEARQLLSIATVVAKDPIAGEEPQGGQTDAGQFVVTRDVVDANPLAVTLSLSGSATLTGDYSMSPAPYWDSGSGTYRVNVTIPANVASAAVNVTPVPDGLVEGTEKITLTVVAGGGYTGGAPGVDSVMLADIRWQAKIEANDAIAGEAATDPGQFTITRFGSADTGNPLTVHYLVEGTATQGTDFASLPNTSWDSVLGKWRAYTTIAAGQTTATVNVNVTNDFETEGAETVMLSLTTDPGSGGGAVNYSVSSPGRASVTVADDDSADLWVSIEAVVSTAFEPSSPSGIGTPGRFRVRRYDSYDHDDGSQAITVNYCVDAASTATAGTDYSTLSGSVIIPANTMQVDIDVHPIYDGVSNDNGESVVLTLTSGTGYSVSPYSANVAMVWIDDTGANSAADSAATTGEVGGDHDGALKLAVPGTDLVWLSTADPRPIVSADVKLQPTNGGEILESVWTYLTLGGVESNAVCYSPSGVSGSELYRFSLQMDASSLATGRYDWGLHISQNYAGFAQTSTTPTGQRDIVNWATSPFGKSWNLAFLDRLYQNSRGVLLVHGDGGTGFFNNTTTIGQYAPEAGHPELDKLFGDWTSGFTLTYKDGGKQKFNAYGILTSSSDRLGNTTTYSYTDADSDGQTDDPSQMVDAAGRTTTFSYTSGRLNTITDFAGRVTTLSYDGSGQLTSVVLPDPDGAEPLLTSPEWQFGYNPTTHLLTSQTDPAGKVTSYAFDFARTLQTITHPDTKTDTLGAVHVRALVDTGAGQGSEGNPAALFRVADIEGYRRDELNHELNFTTGRFARVTSLTDAAGNVTTLEYNDQGQITKLTEPDPDVADPLLSSPVTQYQYDANGNLTQITLPCGATKSWTYDATFNKPTGFTDQLGHQTLYTLDPFTGNTLSVSQVVGQVDDPQNGETDDVVTSFTYTPAPATSGDAPAGLVSTMTDPLGRVTRYIYNAHGLTTMIVAAVGTADQAVVRLQYDAMDNLAASIDGLGRQTTFAFDNLNRLTSVIQPDPGTGAPETRYQYDPRGLLAKEIDPLGGETWYAYDSRGRMTQVSRPDHDDNGVRTNTDFAYTATGQIYTVTDALGRVTTYAYDTLDRLRSITQPDPDGPEEPLVSPVTVYDYDNLGRLTSVTQPDPDGVGPLHPPVTKYAYNLGNYLARITAPNPLDGSPTGPETNYFYNAVGNLTSQSDPLGRTTAYGYDALDRRTSVTDALNKITTYVYDKAGNPTSVTDPLGHTTTYGYDALDRRTSLTNALYKTTNYAYNAVGQLTSVTLPDPDGVGPWPRPVIVYDYDSLLRRTKVIGPDPDGDGLNVPETNYGYNAAGQLTSVTDPLGFVTSFEYDPLGRKNKIIEPGAAAPTTEYDYDAVGNMRTRTDPVLNTTTWIYDNLNRVTQETNQLSQSRSFEYSATGYLTERTDRLGRVIDFIYDNSGRQTDEKWRDHQGGPVVRTLSYTYDAASQRRTASDPAASYTYTYDNLGRVTWIEADIMELTPNIILDPEYDDAGNRSHVYAYVAGTFNFANVYTYDVLDRMETVLQSGSNGQVAVKKADFYYDALDRPTLTVLKQYSEATSWKTAARADSKYDNASRLTDLTYTKTYGGATLAGYSWRYDDAGRLTWATSTLDGMADYTYDNTDQLTGADYSYQTDEAYNYDANGNRSNYTTTTDNRLASDGSFSYTYDAEGNRTRRRNLSTGWVMDYTYDHRNRLTSVTNRVSAGGTVTKKTTYIYDVDNRLVRRFHDPDGGGPQASNKHYYVYDGDQMLMRFDGTSGSDLANRYLWGPAVDQFLSDEQLTSPTVPGTVYFGLTDNQGTVRDLALLNLTTDTTTIANHRVYDSFGNLKSQTNAAVDVIFGYTGRQYDKNTALQNNVNRWYDPNVGRWLSQDPIGFAGGDGNLYRYVGNSPTGSTDRTGLAVAPPRDQPPPIIDAPRAIPPLDVPPPVLYPSLPNPVFGNRLPVVGPPARPPIPNRNTRVPPATRPIPTRGPSGGGSPPPGRWACSDILEEAMTGRIGPGSRETPLLLGSMPHWRHRNRSAADNYPVAELSVYMGSAYVQLWEITASLGVGTAMTPRMAPYPRLGTVRPPIAPSAQPPGSYLAGKAPGQVTPGTRVFQGQFLDDLGRVQPWTAHYDQYGRLIGRTDFNAGNRAAGISDIHHHIREYNCRYPLGRELPGHFPGEYTP